VNARADDHSSTSPRRWPWRSRLRTPDPGPSAAPPPAAGPATQPAPVTEDTAPDRQPVDICFVFDTTGSMSGKIKGLTDSLVKFVGELGRLSLDWRITAVPFGDLTVEGDKVVDDLPFVRTPKEGQQMLRRLPRFSGGSNIGESSLQAVLAGLAKPYRSDAVIVLVVLTDEPPLESGDLTADFVADQITAREVICFAAATDHPGYRRWAADNGGQWYQIKPGMNTADLLGFLSSLVIDLPQVAKAVHDLGGGSVRRYLDRDDPDHQPS
jgi:hypothetical protein